MNQTNSSVINVNNLSSKAPVVRCVYCDENYMVVEIFIFRQYKKQEQWKNKNESKLLVLSFLIQKKNVID